MKKKFEDNLNELKEIAAKLECGNLDLEEALVLYEKGMKTVRECEMQLADTESAIKFIGHTNEKSGDA